jgi:hypothetical protein
MNLIWTYSSKLNRSKQIKDEDILSLYKTSIELGKQNHFTRAYTDKSSKDFFEALVDEVVVLPGDFEYYFLDDIKFYVMVNETEPFTLIDGDLFLYQALPPIETDIGVELFYKHHRGIFYDKYNKVLESNSVEKIIPYWQSKLGYYNLGLITINDNRFVKDFYSEYNKLKQFYKENIEGVYFNRVDECVEMSLCTYFFTMYCMINDITSTSYYKLVSLEHLCGPNEKYKLEHILKHKRKTII